jgi:hypothetical protein
MVVAMRSRIIGVLAPLVDAVGRLTSVRTVGLGRHKRHVIV